MIIDRGMKWQEHWSLPFNIGFVFEIWILPVWNCLKRHKAGAWLLQESKVKVIINFWHRTGSNLHVHGGQKLLSKNTEFMSCLFQGYFKTDF